MTAPHAGVRPDGQARAPRVLAEPQVLGEALAIVVLDEGRVVGQGTHEELLENCEVYRQIAQSQLSEDELKGGR